MLTANHYHFDRTMASDEGSIQLPECGDSIDASTFEQILEMDDDEDERDFSKGIVFGFFEQAESTFRKMEDQIKSKDLKQLSSLGHFLKGSSATLGLNHIRESCEKIQHWGAKKDETGTNDESEEACLKHIKSEMPKLRDEYAKIEQVLKRFYGDSPH